MTTGKRLFHYAALFKKTILLALLMLSIAVTAELTGPFIAKKMIDTHIMGIELPWYEISEGENAVAYKDKWYKRQDHFAEGESRGKEVRVLQVGRDYYFIDQTLPFDGERKAVNGTISIVKGTTHAAYKAEKLTNRELFAFFQPEIKGLLYLAAGFFCLLVVASFFHYGQKFMLQVSANQIIQKLRVDVFAHIQRLPVTYFDNLPAGKVVARVTNDTEAIRELFVNVLARFLPAVSI